MNRNPANTVDIRVGSFIRRWMIATYGSDYIRLEKHTNLWAIVKQYLELIPEEYTPLEDRSEYITVELLVTHGGHRIWFNYPSDREIVINQLYRCYIGEKGSAAIRRYLENQFRNAFTIYMVGRFTDSDEDHKTKIIRAITEFLCDYRITVDTRLVNRLMKYWYRYRKKNPMKHPLPIFF